MTGAAMQYRTSQDGIVWSKWAAFGGEAKGDLPAPFVQGRIRLQGEDQWYTMPITTWDSVLAEVEGQRQRQEK